VTHDGFLSFYLVNAPKIFCIWLSVWAIRRKAEVDYPLDARALGIRWSVVVTGLTIGRMASNGYVRLIGFSLGLLFLCWPNCAYHLTKLVVAWPTTTGHVESVAALESGWKIGYSFNVGNSRFGGTTIVQDASDCERYHEGQSVTVRYNPIGPDDSKLIPRNIASR